MSVSFDESAESTRIVDHAVLTEAKLFQVRELFFLLDYGSAEPLAARPICVDYDAALFDVTIKSNYNYCVVCFRRPKTFSQCLRYDFTCVVTHIVSCVCV